jgi:hypothetical protein
MGDLGPTLQGQYALRRNRLYSMRTAFQKESLPFSMPRDQENRVLRLKNLRQSGSCG